MNIFAFSKSSSFVYNKPAFLFAKKLFLSNEITLISLNPLDSFLNHIDNSQII